MKYVYIAFCDEIIFFLNFLDTFRTDRQTDIVVHREVTLPKTATTLLAPVATQTVVKQTKV